jgi:hypothetical protein
LTRRTAVIGVLCLAVPPLAVGLVARLQQGEVVRELMLGTYHFEGPYEPQEVVVGAEFQIYVTLLRGVEDRARTLLATHRQRVRQDLQELLREARGRDFVDPKLLGLKRQIREQINATLQLRAVEDVIIVDLQLTRAAPTPESRPASPGAEEFGGTVSTTAKRAGDAER